jgi:DNA helicase-4
MAVDARKISQVHSEIARAGHSVDFWHQTSKNLASPTLKHWEGIRNSAINGSVLDKDEALDKTQLFNRSYESCKCTLLHMAASKDDTALVASLIFQHGIDIEARASNGMAALHTAANCNSTSTLMLLIDPKRKDPKYSKPANVNSLDKQGRTPLFYTIRRGNLITAEALLNRNCDINVREKEKGYTALQYAVSLTDSEQNTPEVTVDPETAKDMVKLIIKHEKRHARNSSNQIPNKLSDTRATQEKFDRDPVPFSRSGQSPSRTRSQEQYRQIQKREKKRKQKPQIVSAISSEKGYFFSRKHGKDYGMSTALSDAFKHDDVQELNRYLDTRAYKQRKKYPNFSRTKLEQKHLNGNTLLHDAAYFNSPKIFRFLVEKGLRTDLQNENRQTPGDIAAKYKKHDIVRFIQQIEKEEQIKQLAATKKQDLITDLKFQLKKNWFGIEQVWNQTYAEYLSKKDLKHTRSELVQRWIDGQSGISEKVDSQQRAAIGAAGKNILVAARAGSGKTGTLVNRVIFLLDYCKVNPQEILVLAFNHDAVVEVRNRLSKRLGIPVTSPDFPLVRTFHALAKQLLQDFDADLFGKESEEHWFMQVEAINPFAGDEESAEYQLIKKTMLKFFGEAWEEFLIKGAKENLGRQGYLAYRREHESLGLNGDWYKSPGEKILGNYLFEGDIEFTYEEGRWWNGIRYRPDFTIKGINQKSKLEKPIILEYFGMAGKPEYDKQAEQKRNYWNSPENKAAYIFEEISPKDMSTGNSLVEKLQTLLEKHGVEYEKLSEEAIWDKMKVDAISEFSKAVKRFIGLARKRRWSPAQVESIIASRHTEDDAERYFLEVAPIIYRRYLQQLKLKKRIDFDGLLDLARVSVNEGNTIFKSGDNTVNNVADLKYVLIDEFQDFQSLFFELLDSIRKINPAVNIFAVGDDWQAINGWAGAELKFFKDPDKYFGRTELLYMTTNYRSTSPIVETSNDVMADTGGEPGVSLITSGENVEIADLSASTLKLTPLEKIAARNHGDIIPPLMRHISRLLKSAKSGGGAGNVVILSRKRKPDDFGRQKSHEEILTIIRSLLPAESKDRVKMSTVHTYKGLEEDSVIMLEGDSRNYPLIHPNWIFNRVFGNEISEIEKAEKRLFYVAMTRGKSRLVIFTSDEPSPFVTQIRSHKYVSTTDWQTLPAHKYPDLLMTQVSGDTFQIHRDLKSKNRRRPFSWDRDHKVWTRAENRFFTLTELRKEAWTQKASLVHIKLIDGLGTIKEEREIVDGKWQEAA